jgi:hypothetical protein
MSERELDFGEKARPPAATGRWIDDYPGLRFRDESAPRGYLERGCT